MKIDTNLPIENVAIRLPAKYKQSLDAVMEACKKTGKVHIVIEPIRRIRSTGPLSQNHRINGFIQQICDWTGEDFQTVKMYCKEKAFRRGYPMKQIDGQIVCSKITGEPVPESEANISVEEAGFLIAEIEQLAAEFGISLVER